MGFVTHAQLASSVPLENIVVKDNVEESIATKVTVVKSIVTMGTVVKSIATKDIVMESIAEVNTVMVIREANIVEAADTKRSPLAPVAFELGLRVLVKIGG